MMFMKYAFAIALPLAVFVILHLAGVPVRLGAHPWWAGQVLIVGGVAGTGLAMVLRRHPRPVLIIAILVGLMSWVLADLGKARFAASYAEDIWAGRAWYFGWIFACIGGATSLALVPFVRSN